MLPFGQTHVDCQEPVQVQFYQQSIQEHQNVKNDFISLIRTTGAKGYYLLAVFLPVSNVVITHLKSS